jgi:predicted metal-dependent hydrolase
MNSKIIEMKKDVLNARVEDRKESLVAITAIEKHITKEFLAETLPLLEKTIDTIQNEEEQEKLWKLYLKLTSLKSFMGRGTKQDYTEELDVLSEIE